MRSVLQPNAQASRPDGPHGITLHGSPEWSELNKREDHTIRVHLQTSWSRPKRSLKLSDSKSMKTRAERPTQSTCGVGVGPKTDPFWTLVSLIGVFKCLKSLVGASGFEPPTSWSRTRRSSQAEPRPENTSLACWMMPEQQTDARAN